MESTIRQMEKTRQMLITLQVSANNFTTLAQEKEASMRRLFTNPRYRLSMNYVPNITANRTGDGQLHDIYRRVFDRFLLDHICAASIDDQDIDRTIHTWQKIEKHEIDCQKAKRLLTIATDVITLRDS